MHAARVAGWRSSMLHAHCAGRCTGRQSWLSVKLRLHLSLPLSPTLLPGIEARLGQTEKGIDVLLVSDGSGAGRGGKDKGEVLPPLMPGLKPRQQ